MANKEHFEILKHGSNVWNTWLRRNPQIYPDLRNLDLTRKDLFEYNLHNANLRDANLTDAILVHTNLAGADLTGANLTGADFGAANLREAFLDLKNYHNLSASDYSEYLDSRNRYRGPILSNKNLNKASFEKTILTKAYLRGANFNGTNLKGADLTGAVLWNADLRKADISWADLTRTKFWHADLRGAKLEASNLEFADLTGANLAGSCLRGVNLEHANLSGANLERADLITARLHWANLNKCNLTKTNLQGADLREAILVDVNLEKSNISDCKVYGISAWNSKGNPSNQSGLIITQENEQEIKVDDLELAQFIFLLIRNRKIRQIIDTITSKVVLILGNFKPEHKAVLDVIRDALREWKFVPVIFDWEKPSNQDLNETIVTLAQMARFVIADLTEARSVPHELQLIVPQIWKPVLPLIHHDDGPYAMMDGLKKYPWLLAPRSYENAEDLLNSFEEKVIKPVAKLLAEIHEKKQST